MQPDLGDRGTADRYNGSMGIGRQGVAFVGALSRAGVDFHRTLTVGRQGLYADARDVQAGLREAGVEMSRSAAQAIVRSGGGYAEPLFQHLGAHRVDSIDASDYEGATIVHDLNVPLQRVDPPSYSVVLDGGSLEHVFDVATALRTCLGSVSLGGHYLAISPVNNYSGHGFYQFTPELYYRTLSEQNGFHVRCVLWRASVPLTRWYRVADPGVAGHRLERTGFAPALLYVVARRVALRDIFAAPPQQIDYSKAWSGDAVAGSAAEPGLPPPRSGMPGILANRAPLPMKDAARLIAGLWPHRGRNSADFQPITLSALPQMLR